MKKMLLYIIALNLLGACNNSGKGPEKPVGPEPEHVYANTFAALGEIAAPGIWEKGETLLLLEPSSHNVVGKAQLMDGEGTTSGTFTVSTDLEAGSRVCFQRAGVDLPVSQEQAGAESQKFALYAYGISDEVELSRSFPPQFNLSQEFVPLGISISAEGSDHIGKQVSDISFTGDRNYTLSLATPITLSEDWQTVWLVVKPADLREKICTVGVGNLATVSFEGDNIPAGASKKLKMILPDAVMTPGSPGAADVKTTVEYKKTAETASYSKASAILVDGLLRMPRYNADPSDRWGGYAGVKPDAYVSTNTDGFWRTGKYNGRWVCVNPDGNVTILHGMNGAAPNYMKEASSALAQAEYEKKFATQSEWAEWTNKALVDCAFNFYSTNPKRIRIYRENYSEDVQARMRSATPGRQLSQVEILYLLRTFSWDYNSITGKSFNAADGSVFALMFDPDYLDYIDKLAADGTALFKDDRAFLGYYLDNELQFRFASASTPAIYLKHWLALDTSASKPRAFAYAKAYAENFMREKYGVEPVAANVTNAMDDAFLADISDYYYRTATEAVRRHDPNHLILGSRLHGKPKTLKQVHEACANYCDIVSVNVYGVWEPNDDYFISQFKTWVPDKPCFVTEFYTRDATATFGGAAYGNTGEGGGWIVKGQTSRGQHYQNFTRKLISYDHCIGWQWFQMTDDYSETYGWNNKGIISPSYELYTGCTDLMRRLHWNIYQIMDLYHAPGGASAIPADSVRSVLWE